MVGLCFGTGYYIGGNINPACLPNKTNGSINTKTSTLILNYSLIVTSNLTQDEIKFLIAKEV
jgi:hypothetical protein